MVKVDKAEERKGERQQDETSPQDHFQELHGYQEPRTMLNQSSHMISPVRPSSQESLPIPGLLQRLPFCGKQTKKLQFVFPDELKTEDSVLVVVPDEISKYNGRRLQRITCGIYEAIGSIKLHFNDGVETQIFGSNTN